MAKVAVFVGSLRRASINRRFAEALAILARPRLELYVVEIGDLPMYNDDLWDAPPTSVLRVKNEIRQADAVLFLTPEYNRSIPPVLKNVIDWGTRPKSDNSWAGKPAAIAGASPGVIGTAAAQAHLRTIAPVIDLALMGQPEVYFSFKENPIDDVGQVTDAATRTFLTAFLGRFESWIARVSAPSAPS